MDTLKLQDKSLWVKRPEFLKIVDIVKNRIQSGELKAGDKIRPEQYLSVEFNVSRTMIKKALMILINEGYVYLIPSKGYYVCEKEFYPYTLCFDEIFGEGGQFEEVRVISMNIIKPDFDVCRQLLISAKQNVIEIKRVYLSEKRIKVYEEKYIPYLRGVPIIEANLKDMVFLGNISSKKPKTASTKTLNIIAKLAKGKIRQLLDTMEDEPILAVEQKQFDEHDKPIEWRVLYFAESGKKGLRAVTSAI
ncbi:GntR family transcriptional regulator [Acetobacterium malicum]|uniref:GntR family transcriptional regulator n=1 Tax=Acetobacterium malicum TaxID=52692 RepID=UPI00146FBB53|nr:GntR family transcriptional regulator [Acetobacterium dehalogenans]